jgi:hypothetical protein
MIRIFAKHPSAGKSVPFLVCKAVVRMTTLLVIKVDEHVFVNVIFSMIHVTLYASNDHGIGRRKMCPNILRTARIGNGDVAFQA